MRPSLIAFRFLAFNMRSSPRFSLSVILRTVAALALVGLGTGAFLAHRPSTASSSDEDALPIPWPVASAEGYSQALFDELAAKPAQRSAVTSGITCSEPGKPPVRHAVLVRGFVDEFEVYSYGKQMAETDQDRKAFAKGGEVVAYTSEDGGRTGTTVLARDIRTVKKRLSVRQLPSGGALPGTDPRPCSYFTQPGELVSGIEQALASKATWAWTSGSGRVLRFESSKDGKKAASLRTADIDFDDAIALYSELRAALEKDFGVPLWHETSAVVTRQDWAPKSKAFKAGGFRRADGTYIYVIVGHGSPGKHSLALIRGRN